MSSMLLTYLSAELEALIQPTNLDFNMNTIDHI